MDRLVSSVRQDGFQREVRGAVLIFDEAERFHMLTALWNYRLFMQANSTNIGDDVSTESVEAMMSLFDVVDGIVKKLDGDPTKLAFGA